jgi:hypothetical protein
MKRIALAVALFVLLVVAVGYNVWRANQEPVTTPPSEVEVGRQKLHEQLEESKRTEDKIEKQEWDSPALLEQVIVAHQQRIDKLKDNSQAGEIIAHDREAIERLQKRIEELRAQAATQPAAGDASSPDGSIDESDQRQKPVTPPPPIRAVPNTATKPLAPVAPKPATQSAPRRTTTATPSSSSSPTDQPPGQ